MDYAANHGVPFEGPRENMPGEALKMRVKSLILCSSSLAMLGFASAPAAAQTSPAEATPVAQTNPAQTSGETAAQTDDAVQAGGAGGEDIVVTGLRQSLRSSQNLKRNSAQIVDAIVAEDIGKLPDIAVSDTAARIPGVQVDRGGGEAGRVLVRGLPDFATTYNGREIFTAERRSVALQDFPSGAIGAVEVFKTSTADLVEPGLAGLVNVRSRRPFDFKGLEVAGSVWGLYPKQSQKKTPNGNLLISDRWDVGGGEFGALIDFSYTQLQYLDSERSNTDFVADPVLNGTRVRFPDIQRIFYGSGNRVRPSINGALQWRPMPGLEFYAEGLWQGFRNKISDRLLAVPLWGGAQYNNIVTQPGNLVQSGTVVNPFRPDGFQGGTYNKTNTYQFAIGGSYDAGPVRITADLARTDTTFTGSTASVDYAFANQQTVNFNTDITGNDGGAEFSFQNFDAANPANYIYRGFYEEAQQAKGDDWQARVDVQYEPGLSFIPRIDAGIRYVNRDAHREFGNRYWNFEGNRIPISQVPLDYELFHSGFRGSGSQQGIRTWLAPTYSSIRENLVKLRQFNRALGGTQFGVNSEAPPPPDPTQTYDAHEETKAAYGQIRYEFGSQIRVDGQIGLRVVKTSEDLSGTALVTPAGGGAAVATPISVSRSYTDWLPNADMRIRFTNELQLRLAASETRTRPNFSDLSPSTALGAPPTNCNPQGDPFNCARSGNAGNPFLHPFTSRNYDASLEYFFSRTGFASAAVFRRDLKGFFQTQQIRRVDPVLGPIIISGPVNSGKGRINGFEAQVSTFFDFEFLPEWARGFGAQANVTYLDAKTGFPTGTGTFNLQPILGVSKWTYNLVGMYEHGGLTARLSYNRRNGFLQTLQNRGDDLYSEHARPISRLDLSTSYTVFENLTVFFDWTNILGKPFRSTLSSARAGPRVEFPRFVRYEETVFSAGIRFRL
jgi:TonB-dependent receptor